MQMTLSGLKVVVTGGSRGIGRAIAFGFAAAGGAVSICARGEASLRKTESELKKNGQPVHAAICDLGDAAAISGYIGQAAAALGGIDVLVNNASGFANDGDAWGNCLNIDLMATVHSAEAALPHLEKSAQASPAEGPSRASIINISSISGLGPMVRAPAYAAAKAALIQYTTTHALALSPKRIRANCIAPGSVEFEGGIWGKRKIDNPALYQQILGSIPMGRFGRPEEIANVALFLASPLASWITGHTIVADGGQLLTR
ncbi:MAG: SDR family oxidoreductase [Dongiaceae bacterium]